MKSHRLVVFLVFFLVFFTGTVFAQYYFGKNKIQYTNFSWSVLSTRHFDIYFYTQEKSVAEIAAGLAEESYKVLESKFNHHIDRKIPLIVYSSPNYFVQTNILPYLLPENVGGFFEFLKGRTVVPFSGSYSDFKRVIRHELVHVFTYSKLSYVMRNHRRHGYTIPPLWFTEGLAEYWSKGWDSEADMVIRDLVLMDKPIQLSQAYESAGGFLMYKIGQSFCKFLSETHGDEKLGLLFDDYWKTDRFDETIEITYGKKLGDLGRDWEYWLKKTYYPRIKDKQPVDRFAEKLTFDGLNVMPAVFSCSADNSREMLAFKSDRLGYSTICLLSTRGKKEKPRTLVKGERSSKFESLHFMDSKISVSQNERLAFVSKKGEKDVIYIYDIPFRKIMLRKEFTNLISLSSPVWSKNGEKVVFEGRNIAGYSNLYYLDLKKDSLFTLTDDIYQEKNPAWSGDGQYLVFSSDRGEFGEDGYFNLFMMDLDSKNMRQLTCGKQNDISPAWSNDDKIVLFSSDRNGSFDLFTLQPFSSETRQLTNSLNDIFDAQFSLRNDRLFFSSFKDFNFQLYSMNFPESTGTVGECNPGDKWRIWEPVKISSEYSQASITYKKKFSFDIAQSAIAYDAIYGSLGGGQLAIADMLGNHQYIFLLGHSARTRGDFLSGFNLGVTHINKTHRLNHGYGLYHLNDEYYDDYYGYYDERQYGSLGFVSYPFSKFERIESSMFLRRSERQFSSLGRGRKEWFSTNYVSLIRDTGIWGVVGPIDGMRLNLTLGVTTKFGRVQTHSRLILVDLRKYIRLTRRSCLAFRFMGFSSSGIEPQRLYLGGSWSLRGYSRRAFYGRKVILVNDELRFPLIDHLLVKFPLGELDFRSITGALFFDFGDAWEKQFDHFYGSIGGGARLNLENIVVLRLDVVKKTDFTRIYSDTEFDFFFGWDF